MKIISDDNTTPIELFLLNSGDVFVYAGAAFIFMKRLPDTREVEVFSLFSNRVCTMDYKDIVIHKPNACINLDGNKRWF